MLSVRITADLELKTSEKSNPYVRFDIAENIGSRQTPAYTIFSGLRMG